MSKVLPMLGQYFLLLITAITVENAVPAPASNAINANVLFFISLSFFLFVYL